MIVTVRNPYFDKTYKVQEDLVCIENAIRNIEYGNESFIKLHNEDGTLVLINPANFASVEFAEDKESEREKNLRMARELWEEFGDVIVDDNECIENPWRTFEAGTSRYDIWHWFESFFGVSVAKDLME